MYKNRILFLWIFLLSSSLWAQSPDFSSLEQEGRGIRDTLHELLLRTKNPNTLGIKGLSSQEFKSQLEGAEARLLTWKKELVPVVNGALAAEQKAKIISFYFTQCSFLAQVRILGGEKTFPVDESWRKTFSFPLTVQTLHELSGGDSPLSLVTAPESPVILGAELETLKKIELSTQLPLQMSALHVQALRQMALSNDVNPQSYFLLVRSMMVGWLLESLDKTQVLMRGTPRSIPVLLGELQELQKNLGLKKVRVEEKMVRELLISQVPDILLFFADDTWIQKLISLLLAPQFHEEYFKIYKEGFQHSEPIDVKEVFARHCRSYPLPIARLGLEEKAELLKKWYAQARFSVVLGMMPESKEWTEETKTSVIRLLQERLQEYGALLPEEPFRKWAENSQWDEAHQEGMRTQYVLTLIELSKKLKTQMAMPKEEWPLDLITLDLALEKDFLMMGLEPATLQRKMVVVQTPSIQEARTLYQSLLKELKESVQTAARPKGSSLSEQVQARVYEKLEKELKEFSKVGEWFFGEGSPSKLGDLPLTSEQKEAYQEMVKIRMMGEHHILETLDEKLASLNPEDPTDLREADEEVQNALRKIEEESVEKIATVAHVKSLEEIQTIVVKSPLLHMLISQYPAFRSYHEEIKKKVLSPDFAEMSWDELFHRTTYPGFTFLLLHWVAKFVPGVRTHPVMRAIDAAIGPYLSYFLITSFSMVGVDAVWQYERIEDKEEDIEILRDYLETSAGDDAFSDLLTVTRAQEERDMMWSGWKSQRAFEAAFLVGIPVLGRAAKRLMSLARDQYYARLYRQAGFEGGKYSWNEMDIRAMSQATVERIWADHASNPKLQKWAMNRVQTAEQKLLKIIKRAQKSMERKNRHFKEEFEALGLESGQWDPVAVITSLERRKALHREKRISQESLDQAIRATQELLREVRVPFMTGDPNGPTAQLQRRLIFVREATSTQAQVNGKSVPVWVDDAAQYRDEGFSFLDPVLELNVQKIVDADGREIELMTYKRLSPYVARKWWPPFRGTFR